MDIRAAQTAVRNLGLALATLASLPDDADVMIREQLETIDGITAQVLSNLGYSGSLTIPKRRPLGNVTYTKE